MQLLHDPEDPLLDESLRYIVQHALESPQTNYRVQVNKITLTCVANTLASQAVTFDKPFLSNPYILLSANPATNTSDVQLSYSNLSARGITLQAYTATAQNVEITYLAIGPV